MQIKLFFLLASLWGSSRGGIKDEYGFSSSDLGEELTQDLYKRLSKIDPEELMDLISSDEKVIRDQEKNEHTEAASKFIYMTGGAGEGQQHLKPDGSISNHEKVKSDDVLPFYCHPPNPCPKGFTSKDGCHDFVEDTAVYQKEWITKMQSKGLCSCDEEHMFTCDTAKMEAAGGGAEDADDDVDHYDSDSIDDVIDTIVKTENPYLHAGVKRQSLVAKKSPRIKRDLKMDIAMNEAVAKYSRPRKNNPYLEGKKLRTVAKKGYNG